MTSDERGHTRLADGMWRASEEQSGQRHRVDGRESKARMGLQTEKSSEFAG